MPNLLVQEHDVDQAGLPRERPQDLPGVDVIPPAEVPVKVPVQGSGVVADQFDGRVTLQKGHQVLRKDQPGRPATLTGDAKNDVTVTVTVTGPSPTADCFRPREDDKGNGARPEGLVVPDHRS
jgi:hypothetical protein